MSEFYDYIKDHLWPPGEVEPRGTLQYFAVRDLQITPNQFTKEKNELLADRKLNFTDVAIGTQFPTQLLHKGPADRRKLKLCVKVLQERKLLMRPEQVGEAGEITCRALFKRLQAKGFPFSGITQKGDLGYEAIEGLRLRRDVRLCYTDRSGDKCRAQVENKNRAEHTYPTNGAYFAKLIESALCAGSLPVLMASHLPVKSVRLCAKIGIATHVYGRQFIDAKIAASVKRLYPGMHQEIFQFVNLKQPFANYPKIDKRSLNDLNMMSDPAWIERAHTQWLKMMLWLPQIAEALALGDLETVDTLLDEHA